MLGTPKKRARQQSFMYVAESKCRGNLGMADADREEKLAAARKKVIKRHCVFSVGKSIHLGS